jgi:hypothetical protein
MVQRDGDELKLESFDLVSYDEPAGAGTINILYSNRATRRLIIVLPQRFTRFCLTPRHFI